MKEPVPEPVSELDQKTHEPSKETTADRVDELESRLAFQDDLIENLNEVVSRQDQELRVLKQQVAGLIDRVKEVSEAGSMAGPTSDFEVPPHY